jgi:hypothetical protein
MVATIMGGGEFAHGQSLFHIPGAARSDPETSGGRLKAVAMR